MTEAERLANWLDSLDYHHNDRVKNYQEAATLIRSQAEELERLRGALGDLLEASERHIFGDECLAERLAARAALGER